MDDVEGRDLTGNDRFVAYVVPEIDVMLRVARTMTATLAEAEDLVGDSLVRALRGIDGFDGRHPRAWLLTIVRNTHINRNRRRRPGLLDDPDAPGAEARAGTEPSAEEVVASQTVGGPVAEALATLGPDARAVVELVDVAGLTYAEAADVLDVPVGTVMSRLHRARRRIRDHLVARGITGPEGIR
ncbi:MAG: RNA polymerase sigma factor [Acidimicrobiales bacterium]|nr:RNA polymerase sigma factor [Acidimicrobiales bacterium]